MPWYPKARRHNVQRDQGRRMTPVRINHHTAVTNAQHLDGQAENRNAAYPHFMIGRDGQVVQYQDTSWRARADLDGNGDTISIETWDGYPNGAPGYWRHNSDVPPWTDAQVRAIVELDSWLIKNHPSIPLRLAKDSRPGASSHGLSWHRLGCDGNFPDAWPFHGRRSGGVRYSKALGKVCPGDRRIKQLVEVIFPAVTGSGVAGITIPSLDSPTDVPKEFPTMRLIKSADKGQVAVTDGVTKHYLSDPRTVGDYVKIVGSEPLVVGQYTYDRIPDAVVKIPAGITPADVATAVREALKAVDVQVDEDAVAANVVSKLAGGLKVDVTVKGA